MAANPAARGQLNEGKCFSPVPVSHHPRIRMFCPTSAHSKRIMFGNLEGAVRRGRGGKEKEWIDCVQSDIWAFGITGDWKTMTLKAKVWVEAVTEGGRRFMAAWREEEEDAARHRQEKREAATRLGKLQSHTEA